MRILLLLAMLSLARGAPGPWSPEPPRESAQGFVCGAPRALCGDNLPAGVARPSPTAPGMMHLVSCKNAAPAASNPCLMGAPQLRQNQPSPLSTNLRFALICEQQTCLCGTPCDHLLRACPAGRWRVWLIRLLCRMHDVWTCMAAVAAHPSVHDYSCNSFFLLACLPAGVTCEKGPGWCEPGYYCGYRLKHDSTYTGNTVESIKEIKSPDGDQRCRPLGGCGQVGGECCPSNADAPHTNTTDKLARKPFCKDGNICVWNSSDAAATPTYAGVRGETRQTSHACCF
jgi:hypothetical protein